MRSSRMQRDVASVALTGIAALLASAALVEYLSWRAELSHRPVGKILRIRGRNVHVVDRGVGPCVVLLHGNGGMVEDLASSGLIALLAPNHRVLALDRPGFGLSDRERDGTWTPKREADLIAEVLATLEVERPVVVGHSWGTLVALSLALRDPASIAGLVLLSGYYYSTPRLDVAIQTPASLPLIGPLLRHTLWPLIGRLAAGATFRKMFFPNSVSPEFLKEYSVPMAMRPIQLKSVADDTVSMPGAAGALSCRYAEIQVPVRLIAGADDKIVSTAQQSGRLQRELPNSALQILEGVGHMTHHARPDLVVKAVDALTSETSPVRPSEPAPTYAAAV
jgi:pimeloyl-ACP methyl ester carboxylesterase